MAIKLMLNRSYAQREKQADTDENRRLIIELDKRPIGEMSYERVDKDTVEIGIKFNSLSEDKKKELKEFSDFLKK